MTAAVVTTRPVRPGFDELAALLEYPRGCLGDRVRTATVAVREACPGAEEQLLPLREHAAATDLHAAQELFVRTFELNPLCALEIGWQLYGDKYARGTFLVRMREFLRELGLSEGPELSDHLASVLRVVARLDDPTAQKLAGSFALPALTKMRTAFAPVEGTERNPYAAVLDTAAQLLGQLAPETHEEFHDE